MAMPSQVYSWLKNAQHLIYPPHCLLCGASGEAGLDLCAACFHDLVDNRLACRRCGLPIQGGQGEVCGACLRQPPLFDESLIPFRYAAPLSNLLLGLKFNRKLPHARLLGELMAEAIATADRPLPELVIPVPLHRKRLSERGYNQALELARPICKRLGLSIDSTAVERITATEAQSSLHRKDRRKNVKGVFHVTASLPSHVAIIDDVVTTGSTVNEMARVLKRAGVQRVTVWACARAG